MRVQSSVRLLLAGGEEVEFGQQVRRGARGQAECYAFKQHGWLRCRALGYWGEDAEVAWLLVTNHAQIGAWSYAQRMWEELAFRDLKSGGGAVAEQSCVAALPRAALMAGDGSSVCADDVSGFACQARERMASGRSSWQGFSLEPVSVRDTRV